MFRYDLTKLILADRVARIYLDDYLNYNHLKELLADQPDVLRSIPNSDTFMTKAKARQLLDACLGTGLELRMGATELTEAFDSYLATVKKTIETLPEAAPPSAS